MHEYMRITFAAAFSVLARRGRLPAFLPLAARALMFELSTSYLHTSWWTVGPRMVRVGEQGMPPGISVQ